MSKLFAVRGGRWRGAGQALPRGFFLRVSSSPLLCLPRRHSWIAASVAHPTTDRGQGNLGVSFPSRLSPFAGSHGLSPDHGSVLQGAGGECRGQRSATRPLIRPR